jgi:hypothetical protein
MARLGSPRRGETFFTDRIGTGYLSGRSSHEIRCFSVVPVERGRRAPEYRFLRSHAYAVGCGLNDSAARPAVSSRAAGDSARSPISPSRVFRLRKRFAQRLAAPRSTESCGRIRLRESGYGRYSGLPRRVSSREPPGYDLGLSVRTSDCRGICLTSCMTIR